MRRASRRWVTRSRRGIRSCSGCDFCSLPHKGRGTRTRTMMDNRYSRRDVLKASTVAAAGVFASPLKAAAPEPSAITPALIEAARKEGKLAFDTAMDLPVAEKFAKTFEARFSGITVRVERSGAERVFQRIGQEM